MSWLHKYVHAATRSSQEGTAVKLATVLLWMLTAASTALATTINVPADSNTVQAGISGAVDGDTVIIADGHYIERIDLQGKSLLIASELILDQDSSHIDATVIDADTSFLGYSDSGSVVTAIGPYPGAFIEARIAGVTLQNGVALSGGGVYCSWYNIVLADCILHWNTNLAHVTDGTRLFFESCDIHENGGTLTSKDYAPASLVTFDDCDVSNLALFIHGDIVLTGTRLESCSIDYFSFHTATILESTFRNSAITAYDESVLLLSHSTLFDTDIECRSSSADIDSSLVKGSVIINDDNGSTLAAINCTFVGGLGIEHRAKSSISLDALYAGTSIQNCIIYVDSGYAFKCLGENTHIEMHCCDIYGFDSLWLEGTPVSIDTSGVLFDKPLFCNADSDDYSLYTLSSCMPENNNCGALIGVYSAECSFVAGDADGNEVIDIDDAMFLMRYIFANSPPPSPLTAGDADCSGMVDIDDVVYLIAFIFNDGPEPCVAM
jgi:hypothetical protein